MVTIMFVFAFLLIGVTGFMLGANFGYFKSIEASIEQHQHDTRPRTISEPKFRLVWRNPYKPQ